MKNPTRTYKVTVPNGAVPGQPFQVYLDEQTSITIICPHNARPGTLLEIDAHDVGPQYQRVVEVHRPHVLAAEEAEEFRERKVKRRRGSLYVWVFFAMLLSLFLILAYSVPKFATQYLSSSCFAVNPATNQPLTVAYFHLWRGYGSSPQCVSRGTEFCVPWTDTAAWGRFDAGANVFSTLASSSSSFYTTQVCAVLASAFSLLAASVFSSALRNADMDYCAGIVTCGSYLTMLAWVLALVAIDAAAAASASRAVVWQRFFQNGNNVATLQGTVPVTTSIASSGCSAVVTYEDGGALLSVATAMAFAVSLSVLLSMCCSGETWAPQQQGAGTTGSARGGSYLFPMPRTVARPSTPATVVATATYAAPPQLPLAEAGMAPAV